MKKYKVVQDRENCIGCGACAAIFAEKWIMNSNDSKVDLIGSKKENGKMVLEITEDELEKFKELAETCPVNVVQIYDKDGKKIV